MSNLIQLVEAFKKLGLSCEDAISKAQLEIDREEKREREKLEREEKREQLEREEKREREKLEREEKREKLEREEKREKLEREEKREKLEREEKREREKLEREKLEREEKRIEIQLKIDEKRLELEEKRIENEKEARVPLGKPKDVNIAVAKKICIPFEENVLRDINLLLNALSSPLLTTIPIGLRIIPDDSGLAVKTAFTESDKCEAGFLVDSFRAFELAANRIVGDCSEASISACIINITGGLWEILAKYVKLTPTFKYYYDKQDKSGATVSGKRPDETDYLNDFLVCKSEHKRADLQAAILELTAKLTPHNFHDYGVKIVHLPVISAAGNFVEFGVIDVRTKRYHQVDRFDLRLTGDRVGCFVRAINFFRLFHTMAPHIPNNPTPKFLRGIAKVKFCDTEVIKQITMDDTCPDKLYNLLSKGSVPNAVKVVKKHNKLIVTPVGVRTPIGSMGLELEEVRDAIRGVLNCLKFIHAKNFVHRDVRWDNLIRVFEYRTDGSIKKCRFLVIDFEFAAKAGDSLNIQGYIFREMVPFMRPYNKCHDMKLVGKLVSTWAANNEIELDENALNFIDSVERDEEPLDAEAALKHSWLS